jgi:hypothetical protein
MKKRGKGQPNKHANSYSYATLGPIDLKSEACEKFEPNRPPGGELSRAKATLLTRAHHVTRLSNPVVFKAVLGAPPTPPIL